MSSKEKALSILSYFGPFFLLAVLLAPESHFAKYHCQSRAGSFSHGSGGQHGHHGRSVHPVDRMDLPAIEYRDRRSVLSGVEPRYPGSGGTASFHWRNPDFEVALRQKITSFRCKKEPFSV